MGDRTARCCVRSSQVSKARAGGFRPDSRRLACDRHAVADDREHAIEEIVESARQVRPRTPRWLWVVAAILGIGCAIAFVIVLLSDGDPTASTTASPDPARSGSGFGAGLALGVGIGIAVGYAIARQLVRDHSSRSKP